MFTIQMEKSQLITATTAGLDILLNGKMILYCKNWRKTVKKRNF